MKTGCATLYEPPVEKQTPIVFVVRKSRFTSLGPVQTRPLTQTRSMAHSQPTFHLVSILGQQ